MSGSHFHVHGPHDHAVAHTSHDRPGGRLAVLTALLACLGAGFSYMAGATQADATLFKDNAAISKTEAANRWGYYQAKSSRQNLAELAVVLATSDEERQRYREMATRYDAEKREIQSQAERFEQASTAWDARSDQALHRHHRWAQAMTAVQVAIALAAIALLTQRRWTTIATLGAAGVGLLLGAAAWGQV